MKQPSRLSQVYLKAANIFAGREGYSFTCTAIEMASTGVAWTHCAEADLYLQVMVPDVVNRAGFDQASFTLCARIDQSFDGQDQRSDLRLLLLCMMAAVCDDFVEDGK